MTFSTERGPIECSFKRFKYVLYSFFGLLLCGFFIGLMICNPGRWAGYVAPMLLAGVYGVGAFFWVVVPPFLRANDPIEEV